MTRYANWLIDSTLSLLWDILLANVNPNVTSIMLEFPLTFLVKYIMQHSELRAICYSDVFPKAWLVVYCISELRHAQSESNYRFSFHSSGSSTIYRQIHGSQVSVSDRQRSTQAEEYEPVVLILLLSLFNYLWTNWRTPE